MRDYITYINSQLTGQSGYCTGTGKTFASPMKELNQKTILKETEEENGSYRQSTKYNDAVDFYYSSYDLGILVQNAESYLEGKIESKSDVDYYNFSYQQKKFYADRGVSSDLKIYLEGNTDKCPYNLTVYDKYGNQIGIAEDDGTGKKVVSIPNWDCETDKYIFKVEKENGEVLSDGETYRIKVTEEKKQTENSDSVVHTEEIRKAQNATEKKKVKDKYENYYQQQLQKLHERQFSSLPEEERYTGNESVKDLLGKMANGEELTKQELKYVKIFAGVKELEKAETQSDLKNNVFPEINKDFKDAGLELDGKEWSASVNIAGKIVIEGDFTEEEKSKMSDILQEKYSDTIWEDFFKVENVGSNEYKYVSGLHEVCQFLNKATNGEYSWNDIQVDENGNISGLPKKMCEIINSQNCNAKYEELRDDIYMLNDYQKQYGLQGLEDYNISFSFSQNGILNMQKETEVNIASNGKSYYGNMEVVI
ncbi:MAG: hypothetical protein ACRC7V_03470 [Lachnospiraceae bacterium]